MAKAPCCCRTYLCLGGGLQATAVLRIDFGTPKPGTPRGNAVLPKLPALLDAAERRRYVRRDPATGSVQQAPNPWPLPGQG
jgi:hypothetical protein